MKLMLYWVLFTRKTSSGMPLKTFSLWIRWVWAATRCWWDELATLPDVFGFTRGLVVRYQRGEVAKKKVEKYGLYPPEDWLPGNKLASLDPSLVGNSDPVSDPPTHRRD